MKKITEQFQVFVCKHQPVQNISFDMNKAIKALFKKEMIFVYHIIYQHGCTHPCVTFYDVKGNIHTAITSDIYILGNTLAEKVLYG